MRPRGAANKISVGPKYPLTTGDFIKTHPVFESAADLRANPFGTPTGQTLRKEGDGARWREGAK